MSVVAEKRFVNVCGERDILTHPRIRIAIIIIIIEDYYI